MTGRFERKLFSEINLEDPFFDELKRDYAEFESKWFPKCAHEGREALVFSDEQGLGAFIALKEENESLVLVEKTIPVKLRLKISTLRLAERFRHLKFEQTHYSILLYIGQCVCSLYCLQKRTALPFWSVFFIATIPY